MKYFQNIFKDDKILLLKKHIAIEKFSLSLLHLCKLILHQKKLQLRLTFIYFTLLGYKIHSTHEPYTSI
jgi:hypothetical protein